jgi:hypothetical protein
LTGATSGDGSARISGSGGGIGATLSLSNFQSLGAYPSSTNESSVYVTGPVGSVFAGHTHNTNNHLHGFMHEHRIDHSHTLSVSVHYHSMDIPDHTHAILYGI